MAASNVFDAARSRLISSTRAVDEVIDKAAVGGTKTTHSHIKTRGRILLSQLLSRIHRGHFTLIYNGISTPNLWTSFNAKPALSIWMPKARPRCSPDGCEVWCTRLPNLSDKPIRDRYTQLTTDLQKLSARGGAQPLSALAGGRCPRGERGALGQEAVQRYRTPGFEKKQ
jgi:hypothetical protein